MVGEPEEPALLAIQGFGHISQSLQGGHVLLIHGPEERPAFREGLAALIGGTLLVHLEIRQFQFPPLLHLEGDVKGSRLPRLPVEDLQGEVVVPPFVVHGELLHLRGLEIPLPLKGLEIEDD